MPVPMSGGSDCVIFINATHATRWMSEWVARMRALCQAICGKFAAISFNLKLFVFISMKLC